MGGRLVPAARAAGRDTALWPRSPPRPAPGRRPAARAGEASRRPPARRRPPRPAPPKPWSADRERLELDRRPPTADRGRPAPLDCEALRPAAALVPPAPP